ncbi:HlyD family efflux transporter periplasmic adaptor subunit [Paracoccus seriniphilus]|uniref:HlyD family efflux transporter periplasmic adaptor subunit n=1 Tax=Paracoccus seriniphilus TaxID=184748 RepID=UPI0015C66D9C|nr:HlyD family efflux transporter periplasmic adaptor subunit [Paracoccus seriniphilus]WCR16453.1 HlyD family efflux transporter periplasmic adaptor subunit [Paracoccus seriniphilus]
MSDQNTQGLPLEIPLQGEGRKTGGRRFRKAYLLVLLVPLLLFAGAVIGMYFQPPGLQKFYALTGLQPGGGSSSPIALPPEMELPRDMVETMRKTDVLGLARLMPLGDVSIVAAPYGAGDARVAEIFVSEGDKVEKGTPVARLDNYEVLQSAVLLAEANVAIHEATLMQTRAAVLNSRNEAQAALDQALSAASEARLELDRARELHARGVTTRATLDTLTAAEQQAQLAVTKAQATLARFASVDVDQQPDVQVASRNLDAMKAELIRAQRDLDRADVLAPVSGTILEIHATPGQRPPSEGIMEMGNTDQMMAEVEIYQDRIIQVKPGQPVELVATALGQTFQGRVSFVGLTVGRQGLVSDDVAANTDARVIRVMVRLDEASSSLAARFTNLEVIARIDTDAASQP